MEEESEPDHPHTAHTEPSKTVGDEFEIKASDTHQVNTLGIAHTACRLLEADSNSLPEWVGETNLKVEMIEQKARHKSDQE